VSKSSDWVSLSEAAMRLQLGYYRVLRLVHIGAIEARKEGRFYRVKRASVEAHARAREAAAAHGLVRV